MLHMTVADPISILALDEQPAFAVLNAEGRTPILLVCEHASPMIPKSLNDLGLAQNDLLSHAVWGPGAEAVASALSFLLDAPLVSGRVSRLVYDCNRPLGSESAFITRSETIEVPGNANLSEAEKAARVRDVYVPFCDAVTDSLNGFDMPPVFVTIHSFSPNWHGQPRDVEIGLLHDEDDRLAHAMMAQAPGGLNVQLNAPYSATDGVTHTLAKHAIPRGLPNVMIEIRNDLITDPDAASQMAGILAQMLLGALSGQGDEQGSDPQANEARE